MKLPKKLLHTYNQADTLLFISTYPKKGGIYSSKDVGGTAYTKNTILAIRKNNPSQKIVVLTTCLNKKNNYSYYTEDGVLVIRCFRRNSLLSFFNLFKHVKLFNKITPVFFELEFASYGEIQSILFLPVLFTAFLFIKKRITLVLHQVVMDLTTLSGHIGVKGIKSTLFSWGLRLYYRIFGLLTESIIVLEDQIKKRLAKLVNPDKIHVIYHGVDKQLSSSTISKIDARKKLGIRDNEFVVLYFGYITWYKGADFLVHGLKNKKRIGNKKLKVILAGGEAPTQAHKKHYKKFFEKTVSEVNKTKHITLTGFIKEADIATYLSASDLAIAPFRTFKSSSGSLAAMYAFEKPFLVSSRLSEYFKSQDLARLLIEQKLRFKDISFSLNSNDLWRAIKKVDNREQFAKLSQLSKRIKEQRDFKELAKRYSLILNESNTVNERLAIAS